MSKQRPLILINGLSEPGERPAMRLHMRYAERIAQAGGLALALPHLVMRRT